MILGSAEKRRTQRPHVLPGSLYLFLHPVTCAVSEEGEEERDQAMVEVIPGPDFCASQLSRASPHLSLPLFIL